VADPTWDFDQDGHAIHATVQDRERLVIDVDGRRALSTTRYEPQVRTRGFGEHTLRTIVKRDRLIAGLAEADRSREAARPTAAAQRQADRAVRHYGRPPAT
jgi:hypothetical protein